MQDDYTWSALTNPGAAEDFFRILEDLDFDPKAEIEKGEGRFCPGNIVALAEFCRLVYRQECDEVATNEGKATRGECVRYLGEGWVETEFFNSDRKYTRWGRWVRAVRKYVCSMLSGKFHAVICGDTQASLFSNKELKCSVLVFRGTLGLMDIVTDLGFLVTPMHRKGDCPGKDIAACHVHRGFNGALDLVWKKIRKRLVELEEKPELETLFITGHSLGGALATLATARILNEEGLEKMAKRVGALYTYGSPRVGDKRLAEKLKDVFHCRVIDENDIVTTVPPAWSLPWFEVYHHVGIPHHLRFSGRVDVMEKDSDAEGQWTGFCALVKALAGFGVSAVINIFRLRLPGPLTDHTPYNYLVRLVRAVRLQQKDSTRGCNETGERPAVAEMA